MRFERDDVEFLSGVRHGRTLGSPVSILIRNTEWPKWVEEMSPAPGATAKPLRQPRPGHADLAGMQQYGFLDARGVRARAPVPWARPRGGEARGAAAGRGPRVCWQRAVWMLSKEVVPRRGSSRGSAGCAGGRP